MNGATHVNFGMKGCYQRVCNQVLPINFVQSHPYDGVLDNNNRSRPFFWNRDATGVSIIEAHNNNNASAYLLNASGNHFNNSRMQRNYNMQHEHFDHSQNPGRFVKFRGVNINNGRPVFMKQYHQQNRRNFSKPFNNRNHRKVKGGNMDRQNRPYSADLDSSRRHEVQKVHGSNMGYKERVRKYDRSPGLENGSGHHHDFQQTNPDGHASVVPKVEVGSPSPVVSKSNLSYEDITENSDDNEDNASDLRERLLRKKHIAKREPGEIDSDEEKAESEQEKEGPTNVKKIKKDSATDDKKLQRTSFTIYNEQNKSSRAPYSAPRVSEKNDWSGGGWDKCLSRKAFNSPLAYANHDDRSVRKDNVRSSHSCQNHLKRSASLESSGTSKESEILTDFSCPEAELADLKEKMAATKKLLRETRDKLLESKVIGSKKALRLQDEVKELKGRLEYSNKNDCELKSRFKDMENELVSKRAEVVKMKMLLEIEKQEKEKVELDLTRTYQTRLTIEVEKLRSLFDIEVAKMQAFYLSQSGCFDDGSVMALLQTQKNGMKSQYSDQQQKNRESVCSDTGNCVSDSTLNIQFPHTLYGVTTKPQSILGMGTTSYRTSSEKYPFSEVEQLQASVSGGSESTFNQEKAAFDFIRSCNNPATNSHNFNNQRRF